MESTKKATMKQLNALQEKSKIYMAGASRGNTKELDVAILKSTTNQFHVIPKEKHVRTLKNAVHPAKPRREVQYLIIELLRRLYTANDWVIALKTLVVIHRLMRETDPSFIEELLKTAEEPVGLDASTKSTSGGGVGGGGGGGVREKGGHILRVDDFLDMSAGSEGRFEFSEWVRAYGRYLDEQLNVYSSINFYLETEDAGAESRMRNLNTQDLLFQFPKLQRLLQRVTDCIPRGSTAKDPIVQLSLLLVVKESFKLYKVVSEGVINLADTFFEMSHLDAAKGLEMYKQYIAFTDSLQTYYTQVDQIQEIKAAMKSPLDFQLATPPPEFLSQMEDYVKEAPRTLEDGAVVPASHKISPPLRRGQHSSRFGSRIAHSSGAAGGGHHDPGMVFPPGVGAKVGSQELSSPRGAGDAAAAAAAPVSGEIDLLSLDFDQDLSMSTDAPSSAAPVDPAHASLTDLFAQPPAAATQPFPNTSFAPQGNPFGGGATPTPAGAPAGVPAPLSTVGLGTTGFAEPPGPVMSQHSPQMQAPAGLVPLGAASTNASRDSLPSANGNTSAPPAGGEPSPAKGPGGTNIRDSALHDPFAQFNSLRSSAEAKAPPKHMPSMQAVRASGSAPLTSVQLGGPSQWGAPAAHSPPPQPAAFPHTPTTSVSFSGPTGFAGGASVGSSAAWGAQGPAHAPLASPGVSQSFTGPGYTAPGGAYGGVPPAGGGVYGAPPPAGAPGYGAPVSPQPAPAGGFPVRFETHGGNGLL